MPTLQITLLGPLLVAGEASLLGANLATARRWLNGRWIPYIPATALRGAVRLQFEALLRGVGGEATGPYPFDPHSEARPDPQVDLQPTDLVARLFGFSAPRGERGAYREGESRGALEGRLRFGDALPVDEERAAASIRIRPGLELDDERASAADRKLFFREMADIGGELLFQAPLELCGVSAEEERTLRAAVEATDALGAGKARGGGEIAIQWLDDESPVGTVIAGEPARARRARVSIELLEPAHFGDGGPLGNHQGTRGHIPGATIRGALAWALLRSGKVTAESAEFQRLFVGPAPARFGDGLAVVAAEDDGHIEPATRRRERANGSTTDVLAGELARSFVERRLIESGSPIALRADDGPRRFDPVPARPERGLVRRTRTRVSIDREAGTAASGRLFSIEQLEPATTRSLPACFTAWIEGLPDGGGELLAQLEGVPTSLGAGRNHGLGRARVTVTFVPELPVASTEASSAVRSLSSAVAQRAERLFRRAGLARAAPSESLLLALVAQSDYVPSSEDAAHPLAEAGLAGPLARRAPIRRFLRDGETGGFDLRPDRRGPLKELLPAIGAGSVFVYEIEPETLTDLPELLTALRRGVGGRTECGCGRFALHSDRPQETHEPKGVIEMSSGLSASALVEKAEGLLDQVYEKEKPKENRSRFWGQTSQLRNLVQIAQAESEVPVLRNFLRYQQGRRATREFWELIGDQVITILEEIEAAAAGDVEGRRRSIQCFFGYLVRHYVYLNEAKRRRDDLDDSGQRRSGGTSRRDRRPS